MDFSKKVCIITGASGAIGRATAKALSNARARLALTYRSELPNGLVEELAAEGCDARFYPLDITDAQAVKETILSIETDFSGIDVLVNCAGIIGPIGPLDDTDLSKWDHALHVNLMGSVYLARAVLPALRRRGQGKIIFFSGGGAAYGRPFFTAYSSAKAALVRFTESLAMELEDARIQVNAVAPGPIRSRMWDEMRAAGTAGGPKLKEELDRMDLTGGGSPERAAALIAFLVSDRSNRVTGRLISAIWDEWDKIDPNSERLASSEAWTLRRVPLQ